MTAIASSTYALPKMIYREFLGTFNVCLVHSYLPTELLCYMLIPVVKNKTGDVIDRTNYRPIALITVISNVFDSVLRSLLDKHLRFQDAYFGFKPGLSTENAILNLKHKVKHYAVRWTPIYACFLDLSIGSGQVRYPVCQARFDWITTSITVQFKYWYNNQVNTTRWADYLSSMDWIER